MESDNESESSIGSGGSSRDYESESDSSEEDMTMNEKFNRDLQPVKDNDPNVTELVGYGDNERIQNFTDEEWVEIGRALSKNTHLDTLHLSDGALNDHKMSLLFRGLTINSSIKKLYLHENGFRTGITSMMTFLQNASNLVTLDLDYNSIQSEEFNFLLVALYNSPIKVLRCSHCNIQSIHIDNVRYPPKLEELDLSENEINEDGCRGLAKLLQMPACTLKELVLAENNVDDTGVEILVDALQNNTSLNYLNLSDNKGISKEGKIMMLKLVNDISSVKATLQSNHTLQTIHLGYYGDTGPEEPIRYTLRIHWRCKENLEAAGREKVIQFQLHSGRRSALAKLQKVHQSIYSEIIPIHLPEVLSLVGHRHGQGELFAALKSSIVELMSIGNRKKQMKEARDYHSARAEQLTAEIAAVEAQERGGTENESDESHRSKRRRK